MTASGMRTAPRRPFQVRNPVAALSKLAVVGVNVTRNVRVCPAWLKSSTDGLDVDVDAGDAAPATR